MSGTDQNLVYSDMKLSDFDEILEFHDKHFFSKEAMVSELSRRNEISKIRAS